MLSYIGYIAAFLTTFSFLPQTIKTIKTKDTESISLAMYVMFSSGVFLWLVYGLAKLDFPIVIANIVTLIFAMIILTMKLKEKKSTNISLEK